MERLFWAVDGKFKNEQKVKYQHVKNKNVISAKPSSSLLEKTIADSSSRLTTLLSTENFGISSDMVFSWRLYVSPSVRDRIDHVEVR